jgi:hypothetical protein
VYPVAANQPFCADCFKFFAAFELHLNIVFTGSNGNYIAGTLYVTAQRLKPPQ